METLAPAPTCPHRPARAAAWPHARYRQVDVTARTPVAAGTSRLAAGERPKDRRHSHGQCRALMLASSASRNLAGGRRQPGDRQQSPRAELNRPPSREVSRLAPGGSAR